MTNMDYVFEEGRFAVIGAGGIGSHFCRMLHRMRQCEQLPFNRDTTVFDFDVVERENLRHQDYGSEEIGAPKSLIMSLRYDYEAVVKRFVEADLADFDYYIICADNPLVRKLIFGHCAATGKRFLDMRSEGALYAVYTYKASLEELTRSLGDEPERKAGVSCQLEEDTRRSRIQLGNLAVVVAGMQVLLRDYRKESIPEWLANEVV